jgi:hypothetical protein
VDYRVQGRIRLFEKACSRISLRRRHHAPRQTPNALFKGYLRYIANRRATQIGLAELFPNEENPFPWMSEMIDLKKERNFFETRVIDYQTGGALSWE